MTRSFRGKGRVNAPEEEKEASKLSRDDVTSSNEGGLNKSPRVWQKDKPREQSGGAFQLITRREPGLEKGASDRGGRREESQHGGYCEGHSNGKGNGEKKGLQGGKRHGMEATTVG